MRIHWFAAALAALPIVAQSPQDAIRSAQQSLADSEATLRKLAEATAAVAKLRLNDLKNAPYSADAITETTQILSDGNRIEQRTTQKLYRDAEGRERREESVLAVGALAQPGAPRVITILDPVANLTYTLDPQQKTAHHSPYSPFLANSVGKKAANEVELTYNGNRKVFVFYGGAPITRTEDLGSNIIEGVTVQGTRVTQTIPAGQIGNLLPIKIVDEMWSSSELHVNILTTHTDPRGGETVYKLINISRANPPQSLFELPAGYTVTETPAPGRGGRGPATK